MSDLHVLIVEDEQRWQQSLISACELIGKGTPHVAIDYDDAVQHIRKRAYDLAIVDLGLPQNTMNKLVDPQRGWELLWEIRHSELNHACPLLVVTAHGRQRGAVRRALVEYGADDFIEKDDGEFDYENLAEKCREAITQARLKQARIRDTNYYRLDISFDAHSLQRSELKGPEWNAVYMIQNPRHFDTSDLSRRADDLNWRILEGKGELWRPEARSIGKTVYEALARERRILEYLSVARALTRKRFSDLWLQFSGPAVGLGVPFELLRGEGGETDYLVLNHLLTRRLAEIDTRKPEPFYKFIDDLRKQGEKLRILIVGANSDGNIPEAEEEATLLAHEIQSSFRSLSIVPEIDLLLGKEANYTKVKQALHEGRYHIFHYAGHGRHDTKLPEASGLVLEDNGILRTLSANELNMLVRNTNLRIVFLNSCLGARNAREAGRGEFYGTLEAIAQADVPIVLGYRWSVFDQSARILAHDFYYNLWHTFLPAEALLQARKNISTGDGGRDDETWASPVLLMQTT